MIRLLKVELEWQLNYLMSLQIEDTQLRMSRLRNDHLIQLHHSNRIHAMRESILKYEDAMLIAMNKNILPLKVEGKEYEGIFEGRE